MLYPLKFKPIYKQNIWGGNNISNIKPNNDAPEKCGESWEISGVQGSLSIVDNGFLKGNNIQEISEIYMGELLGQKVYDKFGIEFPLLFKIIDANKNLSIQVHPDDSFATKQHNAYGKNEAWYILKAEKNAEILLGFNQNIKQYDFISHVKNSSLESVLNKFKVKQGDVYEVPSGTPHSIGEGILLAEIQQTSDVTYRIFDYNRKPERELHLDLATEVLNYSKHIRGNIKFKRSPDKANSILNNNYFAVNFLPIMNTVVKDYNMIDSFKILFCINGKLMIEHNQEQYELNPAETILIPADIPELKIIPEKYSELLEIYID